MSELRTSENTSLLPSNLTVQVKILTLKSGEEEADCKPLGVGNGQMVKGIKFPLCKTSYRSLSYHGMNVVHQHQ